MLLAVLALGVLIYMPVAALNWRAEREDRYIDALTERAAARMARAAAVRVQAAADDVSALEDMRDWGFDGANLPALRVRVEQRILTAAGEAGLENLRIVVDDELRAVGPTRWLDAEVQANLVWTPTFAFLDALAAWPEGFRVTGFNYALEQSRVIRGGDTPPPAGRLRLDLAFPVRADAPEARP